jgi:hypothetical protein
MSAGKIREVCYACTEPILEDEELVWAVASHGHDEPYHSECTPSTFFIEEEDLWGLEEL